MVVPTYNERENLPTLVDRIRTAMGRAGAEETRILVVDDRSPDGTAEVARDLADGGAPVVLLEREGRRGYGSAVRAGLREALTMGAKEIATIDADLSHDPALLPGLFGAIGAAGSHDDPRRGADLAIGSRYVAGGGVDADWAFSRRFLSRGGNLLYRLVLGTVARDLTSGLRAYRREILERIPPESVKSDSYSFLMEYAVRIARGGGRIAEIPLRFVDRRNGVSKMPRREILRALATVARLRMGG